MPFRMVALIGAVLAILLPVAAAACPPAPAQAPGWSVSVYRAGDPAPRSQLFPGAGIDNFTINALPIQFGSLPRMRSRGELPYFVMAGQFRACTAGPYEFQVLIEAAPNDNNINMVCSGEMQAEGGTLIVNVSTPGTMNMINRGTATTYNGRIPLAEGLHTVRLRLGCGMQQFAFSSGTAMRGPDEDLWRGGFTIRVRGPGDSAPRELRRDEIYQVP